jgi:hypothetical protein
MPFTRADIRASIERAGDDHWEALIRHHEDPYPRPTPTPGDVCRAEADRLNELGYGERVDRGELTLERTLVTRVAAEVELVHVFRRADSGEEERSPAFRNYAPGPAPA